MAHRGNASKCYTLTLGSSNPNMSRIPMKPSVACFTALFNTLIDLDALDPAVPTVEACWDATSPWWWTLSLLVQITLLTLLANENAKTISNCSSVWIYKQTIILPETYLSEESVPEVEPSRLRELARLTMVATVRQYSALARASRVMFDCSEKTVM